MQIVMLAVLFLVVMFIAGWIFFRYTMTREGMSMPGKPRITEDNPDLRAWDKYRPVHDADVKWFESQTMEDVRIMSDDGLKLYGQYLRCDHPERLVICVHGYRGSALHDFASQGRWLHSAGCDVLFITQRASGNSEGAYMTFGAKEKWDVRAWARYAAAEHPDLPLFLYGISMGCTTVLLSSVTGLPDTVKGIIADCGFTSVRSILSAQCWQAFHLPPEPLIEFLQFYCILLAKFRFSDADAKRVLPENTIPTLFIHGEEDHFVWPQNSKENYLECGGPKELLMIEKAVHASSFCENPGLYQAFVQKLFNGEIR